MDRGDLELRESMNDPKPFMSIQKTGNVREGFPVYCEDKNFIPATTGIHDEMLFVLIPLDEWHRRNPGFVDVEQYYEWSNS